MTLSSLRGLEIPQLTGCDPIFSQHRLLSDELAGTVYCQGAESCLRAGARRLAHAEDTPTLASVIGACWPPINLLIQDQVRAFLLNTEAAITQFPPARIWICKRGEEQAGLAILRNCLMSLCSRLGAKDSQPSRHCVPMREIYYSYFATEDTVTQQVT